jgi:hypothetical protein
VALVVAEEVVLLVEAVVASAAVALLTVFVDEVCCLSPSCHLRLNFLEANS